MVGKKTAKKSRTGVVICILMKKFGLMSWRKYQYKFVAKQNKQIIIVRIVSILCFIVVVCLFTFCRPIRVSTVPIDWL